MGRAPRGHRCRALRAEQIPPGLEQLLDISKATSCDQSPECLQCLPARVSREMAPRPRPQAGLWRPTQYVGLATAGSTRHARKGKVKVIQLQQDGRVQKQTSRAGRWRRGPSVPGVRKEPACPQGLLSSSLMVTVFTSVYSARAYSPSSRPFPDILKPPNGACA